VTPGLEANDSDDSDQVYGSGNNRDDPTDGSDGSTYESVNEEFLALEEDLDLFKWLISDVPVWERVRFDVNKRILKRTGVLGSAHERGSEGSRTAKARDFGHSLLTHNPYRTETADVLVFGHPRRKKLDDGYWWNIRCDPVIERLDEHVLTFESPHNHGHRRPAKTETLRYLDPIESLAELRQCFGDGWSFTAENTARIERIDDEIRDRFGVDVDVGELIGSKLSSRRVRLPSYLSLVERVDPDVVVLTVSYGYGKATQIEACKRLGVPVVELQHGVIDPYHLGYSFPGDRTKWLFPDHLLVYGSFWRDSVEYPIPDDRVLPVGYPFMESRLSSHKGAETTDQVVFVSQGAIGDRLSRFAAELADDPRFEPDIVYKLHPAETARYPDEYPWLASADLRVADGSDESLYDLFAGSTAQVGVYSTAVYEGLRFGLRTYLVDFPGAVKLRPLVDDGVAALVDSVDDLVREEASAGEAVPFETTRFFEPSALEAVPEAIHRIREMECGTLEGGSDDDTDTADNS